MNIDSRLAIAIACIGFAVGVFFCLILAAL